MSQAGSVVKGQMEGKKVDQVRERPVFETAKLAVVGSCRNKDSFYSAQLVVCIKECTV